jgi:Putative zinc-finger
VRAATRQHACRLVSRLLSQRKDAPLGWVDRLHVRLHLFVCGDCRRFERQLVLLRLASRNLFGKLLDSEPAENPRGTE